MVGPGGEHHRLGLGQLVVLVQVPHGGVDVAVPGAQDDEGHGGPARVHGLEGRGDVSGDSDRDAVTERRPQARGHFGGGAAVADDEDEEVHHSSPKNCQIGGIAKARSSAPPMPTTRPTSAMCLSSICPVA